MLSCFYADYNIAASLINFLSEVNLNHKRVLGREWLWREQRERLIKQLINEKQNTRIGEVKTEVVF